MISHSDSEWLFLYLLTSQKCAKAIIKIHTFIPRHCFFFSSSSAPVCVCLHMQLWIWCTGGTWGGRVWCSRAWWSVWPVCSSSAPSPFSPTSVWGPYVSPSPSVSTINCWSCCAGTPVSIPSSESVSVDLDVVVISVSEGLNVPDVALGDKCRASVEP